MAITDYLKNNLYSNSPDDSTGVNSSAIGSGISGKSGTAQNTRAGTGGGGSNIYGSGQSSAYTTAGVTKGGPGIMNNGLYGTTQEVNDPGAFWRDYINQEAGLPGFNSTTNFLTKTFQDPAGLMMALGNTAKMQSTQGQLAGERALAQLVGGPTAYFDPKQLITSVLQQVASYNPNTGKGGPGAALGAQLYDPDPNTMASNITNFLGQILQGVVPDRVLNGIMNTITIAVQNLGAQSRQGSNSTGGPMIDSNQVAGTIMKALQQFGVI